MDQKALGAIEATPGIQHRSLNDLLIGAPAIPNPPIVEYKNSILTPIRDQGNVPKCVGESIVALKEFQNCQLFGGSPLLSPDYTYAIAKELDGNKQAGTEVNTACIAVAFKSIALESDYLNPPDEYSVTSGTRVTNEYKILTHSVHFGLENLKTALATLGPAILVIEIIPTFDRVTPNGLIDDMPAGTPNRGAHAVLATGYNDTTQRITIRNSWSEHYGDAGYAYLSYDYYNHWAGDATTCLDDLAGKVKYDLDGDSRISLRDLQIALMLSCGQRTDSPEILKLAGADASGKVDIQNCIDLLKEVVLING